MGPSQVCQASSHLQVGTLASQATDQQVTAMFPGSSTACHSLWLRPVSQGCPCMSWQEDGRREGGHALLQGAWLCRSYASHAHISCPNCLGHGGPHAWPKASPHSSSSPRDQAPGVALRRSGQRPSGSQEFCFPWEERQRCTHLQQVRGGGCMAQWLGAQVGHGCHGSGEWGMAASDPAMWLVALHGIAAPPV